MDCAPICGKDLERLYRKYNRPVYIHPDPLEFLHAYPCPRDREVVGLIASCLAYGRVSQILKSVSLVLQEMTPSPFLFVQGGSRESVRSLFSGFKHRFSTGAQLATLLDAVRRLLRHYGSLEAAFAEGMGPEDETVLPGLGAFVGKLTHGTGRRLDHLVPQPVRGSACKRLNLFLRWMVRTDSVDPGGWLLVSPRQLLVPVDVHMHRTCLALGLTRRKQADMRTVLEITGAFRAMAPDDPVRYDFVLTRFGIRQDVPAPWDSLQDMRKVIIA